MEMRLLRHSLTLSCIPEVFDASDNAGGSVRSRSGFVFPPYVVMERGTTLAEWLQTARAFPAVMHMFHDLAKGLTCLHSAGFVHRDLKPDNVLWMLQTQVWKLIDFGIAATAGALLPLSRPFAVSVTLASLLRAPLSRLLGRLGRLRRLDRRFGRARSSARLPHARLSPSPPSLQASRCQRTAH